MEFLRGKNRIYVQNSSKDIIAEIEYEETSDGVYNIYHTFVDESLRGQGVASQLVEEAVKDIKAKGGKVTATCSYAKKWLEKS